MKLALTMKNPLTLISSEVFVGRTTAAVNVILLVLLTYLLAEWTWKLLPGPEALPPPPPPRDQTNTTAANQAAVKTRDIAKWHLFGEKAANQTPVMPQVTEMPETKLNLELRGIFASDDPAKGGAIIADPRKEENFYMVGAQLPGNATLKEIYPDRIVLMRNNQFETLRLPRESLETGGKQAGGQSRSESYTSPSPAGSEPLNSGASIREYRDVLINEPQRLADMIRIEPIREANQFTGYRIQPGNDESFFSRFGLQPGDIVTAVNGVTLDTPAKGLNVLRSLADTNEIRVELKRNGVPQSFVVNIND